jgi:bifunctional DNase/RNase
MFLEMKVAGIALDPFTNTPIVILKDLSGEKTLPIWIGFMEASSIAIEMEKTPRTRPLTHDLVKNLLEAAECSIARIDVTELRDNTFYAEIHLVINGEVKKIDSRPSDAIALALRMGSPIYVNDEVIEQSRKIEIDLESDEVKKLLENIPEHQFGKYKM